MEQIFKVYLKLKFQKILTNMRAFKIMLIYSETNKTDFTIISICKHKTKLKNLINYEAQNFKLK